MASKSGVKNIVPGIKGIMASIWDVVAVMGQSVDVLDHIWCKSVCRSQRRR